MGGKEVRESVFKRGLKAELRRKFPGCVILENDANNLQGIPDLIILWKACWAALECKNRKDAVRGPNQTHYVHLLGQMSFASFIYPENKEQVLGDLQQAFRPSRSARVSRAQ